MRIGRAALLPVEAEIKRCRRQSGVLRRRSRVLSTYQIGGTMKEGQVAVVCVVRDLVRNSFHTQSSAVRVGCRSDQGGVPDTTAV